MGSVRYGDGGDAREETERLAGPDEVSGEPVPSFGADRLVIDARGSIDSRTFDTEGRVANTAKDGRDRHDPVVDMNTSQVRWSSKAGQGFSGASGGRGGRGPSQRKGSPKPRISPSTQSRVSGNILSGPSDLWQPQRRTSSVPLFFKVIIPVIVVLLIIVIFLAFS